MATEVAYLGHDNTVDLLLKSNRAPVDLSSVTMITLTLGTTLISSTNQSTDPIRWAQSGYSTGEIRISLGSQSIEADDYEKAYIVVYDAAHTNGIVWGYIRVKVIEEIEGE